MNLPGELVSLIIGGVVMAVVVGLVLLDERRFKREQEEAATDPADLLFSEPNPDTRSSTPETR